MDKLYKFSKSIAYTIVFFVIIRAILNLNFKLEFVNIEENISSLIFMTLGYFQNILIVLWFILIIKVSNNKLPLKTPSIIGIISTILTTIGATALHSITDNGGFYSTAYFVIIGILSIAKILHIVTFFLFARRFKKWSLLQISAICLPIIPIIFSQTTVLFYINYTTIYTITEVVLLGGLWILFMFTFSKLINSIIGASVD